MTRMFAVWTALVVGGVAYGADDATETETEAWPAELLQSVPAGELTVIRRGTTSTVTRFANPKPITIDPKFRVCRVSMVWADGGLAPVPIECDAKIRGASVEAALSWQIDVAEPSSKPEFELFEVWYVYPYEEGEAGTVFIRQAYDTELTMKADGIDPLYFDVKGRHFPEFPESSLGVDTRVTECLVKVEISGTGVPHGVEVTACDEVFHAATEEAMRRWRFKGPQLDGVPFRTGVNIGVKYTRIVLDENADRAYGEEVDTRVGKADVLLPPDPEMGSRQAKRMDQPLEDEKREPPPEPTWDALFELDHKHFARVGVYDMRWPEPRESEADLHCDVLFGVDSDRVNTSWTEDRCEQAIVDVTRMAAMEWSLKHDTVRRGEMFARFRGTFVYPADGSHVRLRIPRGDLLTSPRDLPEYVDTFTPSSPLKRVPPKLPRAFAAEVVEGEIICDLDVQIGAAGGPDAIEVRDGCPGAYEPYAVKAVKKWRWSPAQLNGKAIASATTVRMRFDNPSGR